MIRWAILLLAGCSPTQRIASNASSIRTLAESSRDRFEAAAIPEGAAEQTAIIEQAAAISVDVAGVRDEVPSWLSTVEWFALATLAVAVCVLGLGAIVRRLVGWIPERQRTAAKLLRESVDGSTNIREAVAAIRSADPLLDAAYRKAK
jgi:outer membrane murein-binding lipoprotein Lpp